MTTARICRVTKLRNNLETIDSKSSELSDTEKKLLKKFQNEFYDDKADSTNTFQLFGTGAGILKRLFGFPFR